MCDLLVKLLPFSNNAKTPRKTSSLEPIKGLIGEYAAPAPRNKWSEEAEEVDIRQLMEHGQL